MNGRDNIAGYTLTVGTADVVITDSVATYDPIIGNLADGDTREYKLQFIDSSFSDQYETGIGTWNEGIATFSRDTVKTSSNAGAKEDFGAGAKVLFLVSDYESLTDMNTMVESAIGVGSLKLTTAERAAIASHTASIAALGDSSTLDVGTVAGTVAAGDDGRFGEVDIGDLDPGTTPDGTELVPALQGVDGVSLTTQQIAGTPVIAVRGHAMNRIRGYSSFNNTRPAMTNTTDGTLCDNEPWYVLNNAAAGTSVSQYAWLGVSAFIVATGTTTTGRCAIVHTQYANLFDPTFSMDQTFRCAVSSLPSVEAYTLQIGFIENPAALATGGMYFQASSASLNWRAIVRDDGVETDSNIDTGVVISSVGENVFRVFYDADNAQTLYYINGALVATIPNATRVLDTGTLLQMALSIIKSAGTTSVFFTATQHTYDIETAVVELY